MSLFFSFGKKKINEQKEELKSKEIEVEEKEIKEVEEKEEIDEDVMEIKNIENKQEESDIDEEDNEEELPKNRFGKLLDKIDGKNYKGGLYKISVSQLCKIAYHHPFNRKLNKTHIEEIKNGIIQDEMLTSTIKLIVDKNDDVYLLDGHHRYNALLSLNKKSKDAFQMDLYIEVYNVNEHDDENVVELFKKANNIKKMSLDDSPIIAISEALKKCVNKYKDMFKDKQDDKSVYRPE